MRKVIVINGQPRAMKAFYIMKYNLRTYLTPFGIAKLGGMVERRIYLLLPPRKIE